MATSSGPDGDVSDEQRGEQDVDRAADGDTDADSGDSARDKLRELGSYIREQRSRAEYSLRHLAKLAGVSNPYLSQIERGLRKPSAEILQGIAKALQISLETLYVKAGILEERSDAADLEVAILRDTTLNERQRAALVEIYRSFRRENEQPDGDAAGVTDNATAVAAALGGDEDVATTQAGTEDDRDRGDEETGQMEEKRAEAS